MSLSNPALQGKPWVKALPLQLKQLFSPLLRMLYLDVTFFTAAYGDGQLTMAYLGTNQGRARFWGKRIVGKGGHEVSGKRIWIWNLDFYLARHRPDCQMVMVETSRISEFLLRKPGFMVPMWIQLALDSSKPFSELKQDCQRLQKIPRAIRKNNIGHELSNNPADVDPFIDTMHYPFIRRQHDDTAFLTARETIHEAAAKSDLLYITHEGARIAGVFLQYEGDTVTMCYSGVVDNLPEDLQYNWGGSYYYFGLLRAIEKKMSRYSLGGTSPFLTDSLTYFKLSFKPYLLTESHLPQHFIKMSFRKQDSVLTRFLQEHPFVAFTDSGRFERHLFVNAATVETPEQYGQLFARIQCGNLGKTTVHVEGDVEKIRKFASQSANVDTVATFQKWDVLTPR